MLTARFCEVGQGAGPPEARVLTSAATLLTAAMTVAGAFGGRAVRVTWMAVERSIMEIIFFYKALQKI